MVEKDWAYLVGYIYGYFLYNIGDVFMTDNELALAVVAGCTDYNWNNCKFPAIIALLKDCGFTQNPEVLEQLNGHTR